MSLQASSSNPPETSPRKGNQSMEGPTNQMGPRGLPEPGWFGSVWVLGWDGGMSESNASPSCLPIITWTRSAGLDQSLRLLAELLLAQGA